jgi:hypothetical protein
MQIAYCDELERPTRQIGSRSPAGGNLQMLIFKQKHRFPLINPQFDLR